MGSLGPVIWDDSELLNDPDGDFPGYTRAGIITDGILHVENHCYFWLLHIRDSAGGGGAFLQHIFHDEGNGTSRYVQWRVDTNRVISLRDSLYLQSLVAEKLIYGVGVSGHVELASAEPVVYEGNIVCHGGDIVICLI